MARGSEPKKVVGKRGDISWKMTIDVGEDPATGKRKQKKLTAPTKTELEKMAAKILADVAKGTYFEPEKQSFGEYLDYWLQAYGKPNLGPRTYQEYKSIVDKHLKPALGKIPLTKLLPAHIQKYYTDALASGRKDNKKSLGHSLTGNTVLHHHRLIKEALHHAVMWEMVVRNVADAVQAPKKARAEIKALTRQEVSVILEAAKGTYLYMPTYLAVSTGMRLGEVLGLRWADVNLKNKDDAFLSVTQTLKQTKEGLQFGPPKSKYSKRRIDLFPEVVAKLKTHKKRQARERLASESLYQDHGLVCCLQDGSPIPIANLSSYWSNVANRAWDKKEADARVKRDGMGEVKKKEKEEKKQFHFHQLRHTAATMMLEKGEPIKHVSEMLGHASIAITGDTYGHVTPAGRKHAAIALGEALFGPEK